MFRIVLLLAAWFTLSWGCLACSYGDIKVLTHLYLKVDQNRLQSIDVEWTLDPMFSQMVLGDFDLNRNGIFEKGEQKEVFKAIKSMDEFGYFIRPTINNRKIRLKVLKNFTVRQEKGLVIYRFTIAADEPIKESLHLRIAYDPKAAYENGIIYHLNDKNVYLIPKDAAHLSTKLYTPKASKGSDSVLDIYLRPRPIALASALGGRSSDQAASGTSQTLRTITEKIHGALLEAQEHPSFRTIGAILLFSLLYGIAHAAGPGHGKTLVATYFSTNDRSYTRGISIALFIALTHVLSAFALTMVLYWFVHTMFSQTISDVSLYMTRFSGVVILLIALYLARQKWNYYRPKSPQTLRFSATAPHASSCGCHSCKTTSNSTDLMLILGAGIVPCPGTIVVFLFAISMGMYTLGILSAAVMSLGMGFTIAITAALGTALRRKSSRFGTKMMKGIDIIGVSIMLIAGAALALS